MVLSAVDGEEMAHTEDAMFASDSQTEDFMIQQVGGLVSDKD